MDYIQSLDYLNNCYKKGSIYGLDTIRALTAALGDPQNCCKIIHIAGTNGKGSVGSFLASVLKEAGYKVGRFTSPAVYCREECFTVNGENISRKSFASVMTEVRAAADKIPFEPTGFELETALALCYFNMEQCDVSIIECGLGGKNDATNVTDSALLTVLTSISLDHTALLGSTTADIAVQKCGIIKRGTQVVSAEQPKDAERVIYECCKGLGVKCSFIKKADIKNKKCFNYLQSFDYENLKDVKIHMLGDFQFDNAALALKCIDVLVKSGFDISSGSIYRGMLSARWNGRFEVISKDPVFILDGAHNPDAALRLKNSLDMYFKDEKKIFIIGVFADKDYDGILKITAPLADIIFTVTAPGTRGLDADKLSQTAIKYNPRVTVSDLRHAVKYCFEHREYVAAAFGSLSFISEAAHYINQFKELNNG